MSVADGTRHRFIDTDEALDAALPAGLSPGVIGLDTEFERTITYYPRPALLQVEAGDGVLLVDLPALTDLGPVRRLLAAPGITKVVHAGSEDMEIFLRLGTPPPAPLFDTQIAAGLAGIGFSLGYAALVTAMTGVELAKDQSRSDWLARPLSTAQRHYAALDVYWLRELHDRLGERLAGQGRLAWLHEDCARVSAAAREEPDPALAWQRIRAARALSGRPHAVLRSLATWRELQARQRDKPRNHVVPEAVLLVIAERQPRDIAALRDIQGLSSAEVRRSGETLCALVAEARENDDDRPSAIATRVAGHVLKRLKAEVRRVAEPLGIEPGLLAPNRVLETLLENVANRAADPLPAELRGWRLEVVGERLLTAAEVEWGKLGNTA